MGQNAAGDGFDGYVCYNCHAREDLTTDPLFQWKTMSKSITTSEADHYDDVIAKCKILNNHMEPERCGIQGEGLWREMCEAWKTVRNELASQQEMNKNQVEQIKSLESDLAYARLELSIQENIYTKVIQELVRMAVIG